MLHELEELKGNCTNEEILAFLCLQGVTLTDLQEAERTFSRSRAERQAQEQQSEKAESAAEDSERQESRTRWSRNADEEVNPAWPLIACVDGALRLAEKFLGGFLFIFRGQMCWKDAEDCPCLRGVARIRVKVFLCSPPRIAFLYFLPESRTGNHRGGMRRLMRALLPESMLTVQIGLRLFPSIIAQIFWVQWKAG